MWVWNIGFSVFLQNLGDPQYPYLLSSEITAKETGLEESAKKEDSVELYSSLAL